MVHCVAGTQSFRAASVSSLEATECRTVSNVAEVQVLLDVLEAVLSKGTQYGV